MIRDLVCTAVLATGSAEGVLEARDGTEALQLMRQHRPEVIVCDVRMPGAIQAGELLRQTRSLLVGTRFIALSGDRAEAEALAATGADGLLVKPFSIAALREVVSGTEVGAV